MLWRLPALSKGWKVVTSDQCRVSHRPALVRWYQIVCALRISYCRNFNDHAFGRPAPVELQHGGSAAAKLLSRHWVGRDSGGSSVVILGGGTSCQPPDRPTTIYRSGTILRSASVSR